VHEGELFVTTTPDPTPVFIEPKIINSKKIQQSSRRGSAGSGAASQNADGVRVGTLPVDHR
jgi:hypothetical protein